MPSLLDLWFIATLGFLGSFGHCVGMCGPITAAFALSAQQTAQQTAQPAETGEDSARRGSVVAVNSQADESVLALSQIGFHLLLNLGRLLSYGLVGAAIGALGSVLFAGGQMAGIGSGLRRAIALITGVSLIWFGLSQAQPGFLPTLPFLQPARQQRIHEWLTQAMGNVSQRGLGMITPLLLGLLWGLIPCGFLYAGQLRAAETQNWAGGAMIMLAFGLGTLPSMVFMGVATSLVSCDRRSQLFRLGGWLTVIIGVLLLVRTGDTMSDYTGHGSLLCLVLALIARPISRVWPALLRYRRVLGVGAFVLGVLHVVHMASHTWKWQWQAVQFMLPRHQIGVLLGLIALLLMMPAAFTSFDRAQRALGNRWRRIHLLGVPALLLAAIHTVVIGSSYWGALAMRWQNQAMTGGLCLVVGMVFMVRSRRFWSLLFLEKYYAPPKSKPLPPARDCSCHDDEP